MNNIFFSKILLIPFLTSTLICQSCQRTEPQTPEKEEMQPSPVSLSVNLESQGDLIPADFVGISFETGSIRSGNAGVKGNFFTADNQQAITIFKQLGINNLRIGGGSVDMNQTFPTYSDIDALFDFAKSSGVKVIYSLKLLNGDIDENVAVAKYIWNNHKSELECFAIGNEPDWNSYHNQDPEITDYPTFLAKWRKFAAAIVSTIPNAKFTGPHTGSNYPVVGAKNTYFDGNSWTVNFANDEKDSGIISFISQHNYVGQDANGKTNQEMIDMMLSKTWCTEYYPALYNANLAPVLDDGYSYRLTESNSFSGEVDGGSNCFATALFSLDYLHWWAEHKCSGVNFHNKQWVKNAPVYMDLYGDFQVNPIGYGMKAFDLGGHGYVKTLSIVNPDKINLTAYAVVSANDLYLTIINKEHGSGAKKAEITIENIENAPGAKIISLLAPNNNVSSLSGITLGGAYIKNNEEWNGQWDNLVPDQNGQYIVEIPSGSASVLYFQIK